MLNGYAIVRNIPATTTSQTIKTGSPVHGFVILLIPNDMSQYKFVLIIMYPIIHNINIIQIHPQVKIRSQQKISKKKYDSNKICANICIIILVRDIFWLCSILFIQQII